jgi:hypothetical protein
MYGCCSSKRCTKDTCMKLPDGVTCGDCSNIKRCSYLCGHTEKDTYCDWFPRRFKEATDGEA